MGDDLSDPVRTIEGRGRARLEVRGSEFLAVVTPIDSPDAAESFVRSVADRHPDASHVVPAWRVRDADGVLRSRSDDDGEPTGSAGGPTMNVLEQRDLVGIAAATVRHFGGTELGVGGLARAYAQAVSEAVDDAGVVERMPERSLEITATYDDSGTVRGILESEGVEFEACYEASVRFDCRVPIDRLDHLADRILSATRGRAGIDPG